MTIGGGIPASPEGSVAAETVATGAGRVMAVVVVGEIKSGGAGKEVG